MNILLYNDNSCAVQCYTTKISCMDKEATLN